MPTGCAVRYVTPSRSCHSGAAQPETRHPLRQGPIRSRHLIENAFCRLKDFRRVATCYDKLAANFLSGVAIVTALAFWL